MTYAVNHSVLPTYHPYYDAAPTSAAVPSPPYANTANMTAARFTATRAAKARIAGGTGRGLIAILGDSVSTDWGCGTGGTAYTGARLLGANKALAAGLISRSIQANMDTWTGCGIGGGMTFGAVANAYDPRISFGSGWNPITSGSGSPSGIAWFGGGFINCTGATGVFAIAFTSSFDTFDVDYMKFSGGGSFDVSIDAGASLGTINTNNATTVMATQRFTVAAGVHTVKITPTSTTQIFFQGVRPFLSTLKAFDLILGGWGGARTGDWSYVVAPQNALNLLDLYQPDLTIIASLSLNDGNNTVTTATLRSNLQTTITKAKLYGDVVLETANAGNDAGNISTQENYRPIFYELASSNNIALFDVRDRYGTWATANAASMMFDSLHPNALMQAPRGDALAQFIAAM